MKITGPKWVKRARQWCVTEFKPATGMQKKDSQTQYWFSTQEEASAKMVELQKEAQKEN